MKTLNLVQQIKAKDFKMHLISFVLLFSFALFVQGQFECTSEFGEKGECILVKECPQVVEILNNDKLTIKEKKDILIKYKCSGGKACCPISGSIQARGTTPDKTTATTNLLPSRDECGKFAVKRIFGGEDAGIFEFPWAALLQYEYPDGTKGFKCGGSLINDRYILTAAHCVKIKMNNYKLISVRLGETTINSNPDCNRNNECNDTPLDIPISEMIIHENYGTLHSGKSDIALLRLARSVTYTDFVNPVCLPLSYEEQKNTYENRYATVTGWGMTEKGFSARTKQKLAIPVMSLGECKKIFESVNHLNICAGGKKDKDSCKGDSGSGLAIKNNKNNWILIGVVSYGYIICGTERMPGVHMKVGEYMDWILKNIKP